MRTKRPPRLAVWLLDRLGYTRENPALAGDLLEELDNGRSAAWYWRQAWMVIASGMRRNAIRRRHDLALAGAGFAAQALAAAGLWTAGWPHQVHGFGWCTLAALLVLLSFVVRSAIEDRFPSVSLRVFNTYVQGYFLCALFFRRLTLAELVSAELVWLLFELASALLRVPPSASPQYWPAPDPVLPITRADGSTVVLHPETVAEDVFASGDEELIRKLFGNGAALESARRSVWSVSVERYLKTLREK